MAAAVVLPQSTLRDVSSHRSVFFVYISPGQSLMKENGLIGFLYTSLYGGASLSVPVSGLSRSMLLMFELIATTVAMSMQPDFTYFKAGHRI